MSRAKTHTAKVWLDESTPIVVTYSCPRVEIEDVRLADGTPATLSADEREKVLECLEGLERAA